MISRGMTLIESLVGLAVASLVAAISLASLSMAGNVVVRKLVALRTEDSAWLALAAIARDLRFATTWNGCAGSPTCTKRPSYSAYSALLLDHVTWFAEDGLKRCPEGRMCGTYLDGIVTAGFIADFPVRDGGTLEVVLWTKDGRRYARTMRKPIRAQ